MSMNLFQILLCLSGAFFISHVEGAIRWGRCKCPASSASSIQKAWREVLQRTSRVSQQAIVQTFIDGIDLQDKTLEKEFLPIIRSVPPYRLLAKVDLYLTLLNNPRALKYQLLYEARKEPEWAQKALTLIPKTGNAFERVINKFLKNVTSGWDECMTYLGTKVIETILGATVEAECRLLSSSGDPTHPVQGIVTFSQKISGGPTIVSVKLKGFRETNVQRGFHIHKFGKLGDGCNEAGPHFNPTDTEHGSTSDTHRHAGDLGNIEVNSQGEAITTMKDAHLQLFGPMSIIGRSIVVHAGEDDLGKGGFPDSKMTGHAGARIACCLIQPT